MTGKRQIRAAFRASVFQRDGYRCVLCGKPGRDRQGGNGHNAFHSRLAESALVPLDAHHITDRHLLPGGGYTLWNGITLCDDGCHRLAEVFHQTGTAAPGFSPDELYARIGTTAAAAQEACVAEAESEPSA